MKALVGIDIGGTNVKIGLIQYGEELRVLRQASIETRAGDPASIFVRRVSEAVRALVSEAGSPAIAGVGIGCPGLIEPTTGLIRRSPNMTGIEGVKLKEEFQKALGLGVEIQNDANAAALGESLFGASKGSRNMVFFTLGTGVGGGVVCDGHLLIGADNAATELGHIKVEWNNGAPCGCGRRGCLEAYAGSAGILRIANDLIAAAGGRTSLGLEGLTTREISLAAGRGDTVARAIFHRVGEYLGRGMSLTIETFNPEKIIIGGGASAAFEYLKPGIDAALAEFASFPFTRDRVQIQRSAFADDVNVIGAAATYLASHRGD
jgi:glucokinase